MPTECNRWSGTSSWFGHSGFKDISETYGELGKLEEVISY